tara:strand:- start:378 stop:524 length:147 start_codon:yes stop_codon:yes gene_type:complete
MALTAGTRFEREAQVLARLNGNVTSDLGNRARHYQPPSHRELAVALVC